MSTYFIVKFCFNEYVKGSKIVDDHTYIKSYRYKDLDTLILDLGYDLKENVQNCYRFEYFIEYRY